MNSYITYEINARRDEVVAEMQRRGYFTGWTDGTNPRIYLLPNGGLWRPNTELQQAIIDFQNTIQLINQRTIFGQATVNIIACIVVSTNPWVSI